MSGTIRIALGVAVRFVRRRLERLEQVLDPDYDDRFSGWFYGEHEAYMRSGGEMEHYPAFNPFRRYGDAS